MDQQNSVHMKIGTRKRLTFIFSYGGQVPDLVEVLELIRKGTIKPRVEPGKLEDFPTVLENLLAGKIKARVALLQE
jgi:propanol-preferring alcohol dehydrogenase